MFLPVSNHVVHTLVLKCTTSIQSLLSLYMTYDRSIDTHRTENKACIFPGDNGFKNLFTIILQAVWLSVGSFFFPIYAPDMLSTHCFSFSSSIIYWRSWQSTVLFLIIMIMRRQTGGHILEVTFFSLLDLIFFLMWMRLSAKSPICFQNACVCL